MLACIAFLAAAQTGAVTVAKVDYHGWADCWRIANGDVELVVVPRIGRVMRFGYINGKNVLWENDALSGLAFPIDPQTYRDYGGDKLRVAPQSLWNWPPEPAIDGQPWKAEAISNGVKLTSPAGAKTKVQFTRSISLSPVGTLVTFQNTMQNLGQQTEMGLWQDAQLDDPDAVVLGVEMTPDQPKGWFGFGRESLTPGFYQMSGKTLVIRRNPHDTRRFGAREAGGVLKATKGSLLFEMESKVFKNVKYPDHGSAQEVSTSPDPYSYAELSQLTPITRMERSEIATQTVYWRLTKG
jgi:hypothetical protein